MLKLKKTQELFVKGNVMNISNQALKRKILSSSIIGNALEYYDFTLCGIFISILAREFFYATDATTSILWGFFAFSAAFWTRPLGAFVFGYIGDKFGRKVALTWSIVLMGIPTFIISVLPSYESIGMLAPIILILCRMSQGLCTGGECNGVAIFTLEHLKTKPGFVGGIIAGSSGIGALLAMFMGFLMTQDFMPSWAWRISFAFGAIASIVGYIIRKNTVETLDFINVKNKAASAPLVTVWRDNKQSFLLSIALGLYMGVLAYTLLVFLNIYLSQYIGLTLSQSIFYNIFGYTAYMLFCPIFGGFSDKISPVQALKFSGRLSLFAPFLVFSLLQINSGFSIIMGQILFGVIAASSYGPIHYFLQTLFPTTNRYTGISIGFTIGLSLTAATTPPLLTYLLNTYSNLYIPAIYLSFCGALWLTVLGYLYPKIKTHYKMHKVGDTTDPAIAKAT